MQGILCLAVLLPFTIQAVPLSAATKSQSPQEIATNSRVARHAANLALKSLNYESASPHQLLEVSEIKRATLWAVRDFGHKYYVEFSAKISQTMENVGLCTASVFFWQDKPRPAVSVNCSSNKVQKQARDDDFEFYKLMKAQAIPITGENIPDSFGKIEPQLEPIWSLALLGSSYIILDKSTEDHEYNMGQIRSVKQVLRQDTYIAFDYNIYLHERPSEDMVPCDMHVVWAPGRALKVHYSCSDDSENGSGSKSEEGSTSLGNFK
ncbi:retinoic acid receptor responder protein 1-like [Gastrophryne carolinensis]